MKKCLSVLIIIFFISPVYSQKKIDIYSIIKRGEYKKLQVKFKQSDINGTNVDAIKFLKNMIYAGYGYKFKNETLNLYFKQFSWYKPSFNSVDSKFSKIDKYNLNLFVKYIIFYNQLADKKFNTQGASGSLKSYFFYKNGLVKYVEKCETMENLTWGNWQIIDKRVFINWKVNLSDTAFSVTTYCSPCSCAGDILKGKIQVLNNKTEEEFWEDYLNNKSNWKVEKLVK